jgi:hypothetical protein
VYIQEHNAAKQAGDALPSKAANIAVDKWKAEKEKTRSLSQRIKIVKQLSDEPPVAAAAEEAKKAAAAAAEEAKKAAAAAAEEAEKAAAAANEVEVKRKTRLCRYFQAHSSVSLWKAL